METPKTSLEIWNNLTQTQQEEIISKISSQLNTSVKTGYSQKGHSSEALARAEDQTRIIINANISFFLHDEGYRVTTGFMDHYIEELIKELQTNYPELVEAEKESKDKNGIVYKLIADQLEIEITNIFKAN